MLKVNIYFTQRNIEKSRLIAAVKYRSIVFHCSSFYAELMQNRLTDNVVE